MKVKEVKEFLSQFKDDEEVVLLNIDRKGHDDAINHYSLIKMFAYYNQHGEVEDVEFEKSTLYGPYKTPCCVIKFQGGS